jgi:hypothetical protein
MVEVRALHHIITYVCKIQIRKKSASAAIFSHHHHDHNNDDHTLIFSLVNAGIISTIDDYSINTLMRLNDLS